MNSKTYSLSEIATAIGGTYEGNSALNFSGPSEPALAEATEIAIALEPIFIQHLKKSKAKGAIIPVDTDWSNLGLEGVVFAHGSKQTLARINKVYECGLIIKKGAHPSCYISEDLMIGENYKIAPFVSIGANCIIGKNVQIDSHCSIGPGSVIGENCIIHSGVKIGAMSKIGDRVILHQNAVISSDGFSFAEKINVSHYDSKPTLKNKEGYDRVASLGKVIINDDVEIGAGSCIDRGTIKNTVIGEGTKIDNLVHIGHNVSVGKNCLICGQVGIAGSTIVEDRVIMGGQVGVADNLKIGHDTILAGKTGVSANVPPNQFMMGNPAMKMENNVKAYKVFRRLPRLSQKVLNLEKLLSKLS